MEAVSSLSSLLPSSIFSSSKPFALTFSHGVSLCPIPRYSSAALATPSLTPQRSIVGRTRDSLATSGRRTLSEGWDLSRTVAVSSRMPKLDEMDPTNMLLRQRIVFLGSQVDIELADLIISQLLFLDAEDQKTDIKLLISSPGGSTTAGMAIYDAMKLCKAMFPLCAWGLRHQWLPLYWPVELKGRDFACQILKL
ncbi:hypothetical protein HPP92_024465 [Vanilla planifolia]|uniref:ATP-dependent Clp protease proteolytic subunit n=1 Tax=Vanilla planifolia TaxID=51239 RepID=A0A835PM07_VANPL|nr:hypothetical protein HPP92_024465 [Vanilla planifolia]